MRRIILGMTALILSIAISSCGLIPTNHYPMPESFDNHGLLVGEIISTSIPNFENAVIFIDNSKVSSGFHDGKLVTYLPPGEHTLSMINVSIPGTNQYTSYPINKKFVIKAKAVVNLGLMDIETFSKGNDTKYFTYFLDNSKETTAFLHYRFPKEMQVLEIDKIKIIPEKYADKEKQKQIRKNIALNILMKQIKSSANKLATKGYVFGPAGTVAQYDLGNKKRPLQLPIETHTLNDMRGCKLSHNTAVCLFPPNELIYMEGNNSYKRKIHGDISANSIHFTSNNKLILVDSSGSIFISHDKGKAWKNALKLQGKGPQFASNEDSKAIEADAYGLYMGVSGYYVYSSSKDNAENFGMWSSDAKLEKFSPVNIPDGLQEITAVQETSDLLVIGPRTENLFNVRFHIKSKKTGQWKEVATPDKRCGNLKIKDGKPNNMSIICSGNKWTTTNGAINWTMDDA